MEEAATAQCVCVCERETVVEEAAGGGAGGGGGREGGAGGDRVVEEVVVVSENGCVCVRERKRERDI